MKTLNLILLVLLAVGPVFAAQTKSPAILLQEGLYAEKTEGNLEKAIEIYQQVLDEAGEIQRLAAKATYQLGMCHLKKGNEQKAAEYFQQVVSNYPTQKVLAEKADEQLKKLKPETKKSVFEQIDGQVIKFFAEKYGETAAEAGQKNLYANSHIYYVDPNFILYKGGMGFYYNWTGQTVTGKTKLSGTSYPNQTLYDTAGQKLNIEIIPDKDRSNFYHIYWIPDEPLAPEESLYYGWSIDDSRGLPSKTGDVATLTMQNQFGSPAIETFFLVLPKELKISQSNPPTGSEELLNFNVYWWTKQVQQGENHLERVQLKKQSLSQEIESLIKQLGEREEVPFTALNELIKIGEPAVELLILAMERSNNWQVPKALGVIQDKRSVGPLIKKWQKADFAPMNDVIAEGLGLITGKKLGKDRIKWQQWWNENGEFYTPEDTIKNFMAATIKFDKDKAMTFVAPDSHDYEDIKETFESSENPFNIMWRKLDSSVPTKIIEANIIDNMCSAVWRVTFKEDFNFGKTTFKAGDTFDLDGNLRKYGDKWLITGI